MSVLLNGTVTFLFTDIEGSTRRWETDRAAMAGALARHDVLLREAIESAGGTVFKTVGDAFCAVFPAASAALSAALTAQRSLSAEDWSAFGADFAPLRVRMALHAGEAEARGGDWFGPPLNRVARLLAAGHGGQVLLTRAAEVLVGRQLPPDCRLHDLGEHRLKDLRAPERVYQLAAPDLPQAFAPLATLDIRPHNLPVQLDSFVGREADLQRLRDLLGAPAGARLVSLIGSGGTGKTRLATQAAAELVDRFDHGAWFVDLAPLAMGSDASQAVITALGLRNEPSRDALDSVAEQLAGRQLLLVLDNCEHVVASAAVLAARLLRGCPGLRILATSREPLAITGERQLPLEPLAVPAAEARSVAAVAQFEAVQLFLDRAEAAQPDFALDASNAAALSDLCRRLDGIPLAIELAAARVRSLAVPQILARLDDRLRLLAGGSRDRLPRQQTLKAAIDWSHDLLAPDERAVLRRLADFAGAVPAEAVEAVCADEEATGLGEAAALARRDVLDALDSLVVKSLVVPVSRDGAVWYRLLETMRVYAAEKLAQAGEVAAVRRRHLGWYRGFVDEAGIELIGPVSDAWVARLRPLAADLGDLLTTHLAGVTATEREAGIDFMEAAWWIVGECMSQGKLVAIGKAAIGRLDTRDMVERRPMLCWMVGSALRHQGQGAEALPYLQAAAEVFLSRGNLRMASWAMQNIAGSLLWIGDLDGAQTNYQRAVAIKHDLGNPLDLSYAISQLGEVARLRGDHAAAAASNRDALSLLSAEERRSSASGWALHNLAQALLHLGELSEARKVLAELLSNPEIETLKPAVLSALPAAARLAVSDGNQRSAAVLLGAAERGLHDLHVIGEAPLDPPDRRDWDWHAATIRAALSPAELASALADGRALSDEASLALAREILSWSSSVAEVESESAGNG